MPHNSRAEKCSVFSRKVAHMMANCYGTVEL
jgi:hypothetical protein